MAHGGGTGGQPDPAVPYWMPWLVWLLGALFFSYAFFHRVAPSVMIDQLMSELAVGGAMLGNLSAFYFYAYAGLQLPVGMLLDRWGPHRVVTIAIAICAGGSLLSGLGHSVLLVYFGRFLVGVGAAFSFVGCLKLATNWFPPRRFALLSGLTMMAGMAGGIGGQAPLAAVVEAVGWRGALIGAGLIGLVLALAFLAIVRDRPDNRPAPPKSAGDVSMLVGLGKVARRRQNWLLSLVAAAMSAPMLAFAGLWGVSWLMQVHGLARAEAAATTSSLLVGWAIGAPLAGWLSDRLRRRKAPLVGSALVGLVTLLSILYLPVGSPWLLGALFLLCGIMLGCMVLIYPLAGETNPVSQSGTAYAFCNMFTVGAGALFQPLIGGLLDIGWDGRLLEGVPLYSAATYGWALAVLPAFLAVGLVACLLIRESDGSRRI